MNVLFSFFKSDDIKRIFLQKIHRSLSFHTNFKLSNVRRIYLRYLLREGPNIIIIVMPKLGVVSCNRLENQRNHNLIRGSLFVQNFVKLKLSESLNSDLVIQIASSKVPRFYKDSVEKGFSLRPKREVKIQLKIDEFATETERLLKSSRAELDLNEIRRRRE